MVWRLQGKPKGVAVTASGFLNDVSEAVYVEPLITVSYIPLSHSSDRMKMWEWMGNGGRVGFAYYAATNWLEHERSKKEAMVRRCAPVCVGVYMYLCICVWMCALGSSEA